MIMKKIFNIVKFILIFTLAIQILSNCKSVVKKETPTAKKEMPAVKAKEKVVRKMITSKKQGLVTALISAFSPNNDGILDKQTFKFNVKASPSNPVESWILDVKDLTGMVVYDKQGSTKPPKEIIWDGKNNKNTIVPDGEYIANLLVTFKDGRSITDKTELFIVDTIPPIVQVTADKDFFTPDNDGLDDRITFTLSSEPDLSGIKGWKISVYNPDDNKEFSSVREEGAPAGSYYWDGRSNDGQIIVDSATEYPMNLSSVDNAGNKSATDLLPVSIGILVNRVDENGKFQISINNIQFEPDTAVMTDNPMNIKILNMLADGIKKFPDHKIIVQGYANKWKKGLSEEVANELSVERAKMIVDGLVKRGVKADNLLVKGKGFEDPIIPLKIDMTIAEKEKMKINRRVEFYKQQ